MLKTFSPPHFPPTGTQLLHHHVGGALGDGAGIDVVGAQGGLYYYTNTLYKLDYTIDDMHVRREIVQYERGNRAV